MSQARMQKLIDQWFPAATAKELVLAVAPHLKPYENDPNYAPNFAAPRVAFSAHAFSINQSILGISISASYKAVEACCGMGFLHTFQAHLGQHLSQEQYETLMDVFLNHCEGSVSSTVGQRFMVNMIEMAGGGDHLADMSEHVVKEHRIDNYPLWEYLHKRAKKVNVSYMPNRNSGNVILHMEVLTQPNLFNKG